MNLESLSCNNCGGPLSVPDTANFVTCNHCSTRLAIRRTESTTFTEQLERLESKQEEVLEKLSRLERQNRVAQIDRAWDRERQNYLISDKHGRHSEPNETLAVFSGVVVSGFGLFWTVMAASLGGAAFAAFGVVFILFGVGISVYHFNKAKDFRVARRRYQRRRRQVLGDRQTAPSFRNLEDIPTPQEYLEQLSGQQASQQDS